VERVFGARMFSPSGGMHEDLTVPTVSPTWLFIAGAACDLSAFESMEETRRRRGMQALETGLLPGKPSSQDVECAADEYAAVDQPRLTLRRRPARIAAHPNILSNK